MELVRESRTRTQHLAGTVRIGWWLLRLVGALFLFVGALQLMKTGAASLDLLKPGGVLVANTVSTLGLGWLGALLVLSGSPIAASALTLVAAGEESLAADSFTEMQGFTMLTGSRLGAAFVVLVVATIYALRGGHGHRKPPLSVAVLALTTTAIVYIPSAFLGLMLLNSDAFHSLDVGFPPQFADLIDLVYGGLIDAARELPSPLIFLLGLGVLLLSFRWIDTVMPTLDEQTLGGRRAAWLERKWPMFLIGSVVALITMSVSVALTLLVPMVAKGWVRRQNVIPYIMGANITTLGDTMLAAFALDSAAAVRVVLAQVIPATLVTLLLLAFCYTPLQTGLMRFQRTIIQSPQRFVGFTASLFLVPLALIAASAAIT
jgi:solute carrier family 34 (sodium-dependent phosphate cotransporter)